MDRKTLTAITFMVINLFFTVYFIFKGGVLAVIGILHAVNFIFLIEEWSDEE